MVPVGIRGSLDVRPRSSYRIHPGRVLVRYGAPLPPVGTGRVEGAKAVAQVRAGIAELAGVEEGPALETAAPAGPAGPAVGPGDSAVGPAHSAADPSSRVVT
jgi:hypothetical protein